MKSKLRIFFAFSILVLIVGSAYLSYTYTPIALGWSDVTEYPDEETYISAQGFHFEGQADATKPGRLIAATPQGNTKWVWDGYENTPNWFYDVEPVNKTHLFVTLSQKNHTEGVLFNKSSQDATWKEELTERDTHDMDLEGDRIYVAPMEKDYYENGQKVFDDRAYVYNRTEDSVTWEWYFRDHYDTPDKNPKTGWTHLNDIDVVNETTIMLSPRNMDQVIFIDMESGEIVNRLGEDGEHQILNHQHNPDVVSLDPLTVIVADSENDRIVEYKYENNEWRVTWELKGSLNWPRDADRLPSGNTLITDTLNHRVIEVTPRGKVVWEYFAPWAPYDADREYDGSQGPTIDSMNTTKTEYQLKGGSVGKASQQSVEGKSHVCGLARDVPNPAGFSTFIETKTSGTPLEQAGENVSTFYSHHIPWVKPRWMSPWTVPTILMSGIMILLWSGTEVVYHIKNKDN
jgi:hypothetical protein